MEERGEIEMRITIDRDLCVGGQNCIQAAPGAFEIDDEGIAIVRDPSDATVEQLLAAERMCPGAAISVARRISTDQ